jgi:hypothetical protein
MSLDERGALNEAVRLARDSGNSVLKAFDALATAAETFSGQSHGPAEAQPEYVVSIANKWDDLSAEAIGNF